MKKILTLFFAAIFMAGCFCACTVNSSVNNVNDGNIKIVVSIFPAYDWVMNVLGDNPGNADVKLLLDNGVDLHNYQPTAEDIVMISDCDMFIYVGGESDEWIDEVLENANNDHMAVINLMEALGEFAKEEELVEGMQAEEHDHEHGHEDADHDEDEEEHDHDEEGHEEHEHHHEHDEDEIEYDEHVWLSLRNAEIFTQKISDELQTIDKDNADNYKSNSEKYISELNALDKKYVEAVSSADYNTLLFADRFPFRYFVDDYDLSYYAAFIGCSTENQATFDTIIFLSKKIDELSLPCVLTIENSDKKIAQTVIDNTESKDMKILTMDSMQTTTAEDIKNGASYLGIMESNLEVLKEALSK